MRVTVKHTLADILELNCSVREQRIRGWLVMALAASAWLYGIWLLINPGNRPEPTPLFFAAGMLTLVGLFATRLAGLGAWLLKTQRSPYELEFDEAGITLMMGHEELSLPWSRFSRWLLTRNLLVLVSPAEAVAVPKAVVTTLCGSSYYRWFEANWVAPRDGRRAKSLSE